MNDEINILRDIDEDKLGSTVWDLINYSKDSSHVKTSAVNIGTFDEKHSHKISYRTLGLANTKQVFEIFTRTNNELNKLHSQNERLAKFAQHITHDVNELKHALSEVIALCQQQGRFIQQLTAMLDATESLMKQQEELATQSEAQYLAVKRKIEELNKKQ